MTISFRKSLTLFNFISEGNKNIFDYLPQSNYISSYSGRNGLLHIINSLNLGGGKILIPSIVAEGLFSPISKSNLDIEFYKLDKHLRINLLNFKKLLKHNEVKIIVLIHYFGYEQPIDEVRKICDDHNIILIEDCAQALFSKGNDGKYLGGKGDISLFSLPKSLPVPEGALFFFNNKNLEPKNLVSKFSLNHILSHLFHTIFLLINSLKVKSLTLKKITNILASKIYWSGYYYFMMRMDHYSSISSHTSRLLSDIDYEILISHKIFNNKFIQNIIKGKLSLFPTAPDKISLGLIIFSDNRDLMVSKLKQKNIEPIIINETRDNYGRWNYIPDKELFPNEDYFMEKHMVIPVPYEKIA